MLPAPIQNTNRAIFDFGMVARGRECELMQSSDGISTCSAERSSSKDRQSIEFMRMDAANCGVDEHISILLLFRGEESGYIRGAASSIAHWGSASMPIVPFLEDSCHGQSLCILCQ